MAVRAYAETVGQHEGEQATIKGWLYNKTDKGKLQFLMVRDGTGIIQAVAFRDDMPAEAFEAAQQATQESSIIMTGIVRADERAPGGYELALTGLEIVQLPPGGRAQDEEPSRP